MYNFAVCDDNPGFLDLFCPLLKRGLEGTMPKDEGFKLIKPFSGGREVLEYIETQRIDVLFLDIDMPDFNGFELAKRLCRDYKDTLIVFMSAYDNYVYESFDYMPFAYMRKQRIEDDLPKTLQRVRDRLLQSSRYVTLIIENVEQKLDVKDILYFESQKNYYLAHMANGRQYVCRGTLTELEEHVADLDFFRVHSAFLVNLEYVDKVTNDGSLLIGKITLPVAQKRQKQFKAAFFEYTRRKMGI